MATFTRQVAIDHDDVDFIALDHPLVQSLIDFCLDSERVKGEIAVKTTEDDTAPASASRTAWDTSLELEMWLLRSSSACTLLRMERSPRRRPRSSIPYRPRKRVLSMDSTGWRRWLMTCISRRRWKPGTRSNRSLRRPREERERETDIKRHAERHFKEEISRWEERLEAYQARDEQGEDMSAPIGNAKRQLDILRREQKTELERLDEEQHVTPEEPELITASFVLSAN